MFSVLALVVLSGNSTGPFLRFRSVSLQITLSCFSWWFSTWLPIRLTLKTPFLGTLIQSVWNRTWAQVVFKAPQVILMCYQDGDPPLGTFKLGMDPAATERVRES